MQFDVVEDIRYLSKIENFLSSNFLVSQSLSTLYFSICCNTYQHEFVFHFSFRAKHSSHLVEGNFSLLLFICIYIYKYTYIYTYMNFYILCIICPQISYHAHSCRMFFTLIFVYINIGRNNPLLIALSSIANINIYIYGNYLNIVPVHNQFLSQFLYALDRQTT